ncbi:hypothetical protein V2W30_28185 [Streptomyces sp. Q6]|uniref:Uncharacterized protein n=1 Tax=Streptomyces citrinus TaxID=3118173 RepID=A0ACD5AI30_9ACTN
MRRITLASVLAATATAVALAVGPALAAPPAPRTERISVSAAGEQGDADSGGPLLSSTGRYAVFSSYAANLVPGDTFDTNDVFVRDLKRGALERVSVASDGTPANGQSEAAGISADGRYVVFRSTATNLVPQDPRGPLWAYDVYVHDRRTGTTELVSGAPDGVSAYANWTADISDDGRYVAFNARPYQMEGEGSIDPAVYLHDRETGTTKRVSNRAHPTLAGYGFDLSGNGRYLAYSQNGVRSGDGFVYVRDLRTGAEEQVNVTPDGSPSATGGSSPHVSNDGRTVSFGSWATDLLPGSESPTATDIYVRDLRTGTTRRVIHDGEGEAAASNGVLSADGRHLAYEMKVGPAVNVYVRNLRTGATTLVSGGVDGGPLTDVGVYAASLDAHGRTVGLGSTSAQLVADDTNGLRDTFVRRLRP